MVEKPFVHLHAHTDLSNNSMFESITSIEDYIDKALEWNMPAIAVTNHGNVASWLSNMQKVKEKKLKFIHGMEAYLTDDSNDLGEDGQLKKKTRDNYHLILLAKNWEGAKEINKLSSNSYDRSDNHFHHKPRVFFDELKDTSDNIIILTACLGSPLNQNRVNGNKGNLKKWEDFFIQNKDRVYLEVQAHIDDEQIEYNKYLLEMAEKHDMNIVATNDVHNLDEEYSAIARMIKNSKGIQFDSDDSFETTFKSRSEMFDMFLRQGVLSENQINVALDNTVEIASVIEEFDVDTSIKYPHIFNKDKQMVGKTDVSVFREKPFSNSIDLFKQIIVEGYKNRGIDKLPQEEQRRYKQQVAHEVEVYIKTDSIDYMLLEYSLKKEAREGMVIPNRSIKPGFARGSVGGSLVAYLLNVTEVDPIRDDLVFERFMSEDRKDLPDVDSDWFSEDKDAIVGYLLNRDDINCAVIMTKGTYATKGAMKAIGKGLKYPSTEMNILTKEYDKNNETITDSMIERYPDLFEKVKLVEGTVSNFGRHAGGVLVSSENIKEIVGLQTLDKDNRWITQLDMGEISHLNLVKLDVLGVDNIGLFNNIIEMAQIPYITPDSSDIDTEDDKVWASIRDDNTGIFQFESDRAGKILKDILSDRNLERVRKIKPDIRRIDLMSLANAAQRPSGASYVEQVTNGIFKDNGHDALNQFLADTQGFMVFQEQAMDFLVKFAKFKRSESDTVRKGISKKKPEIMNREVPKITPNFIETMVQEYGDTEEHAREIVKDFVQVFMDSVNYGFNRAHSIAYSWVAYYTGWLRYYYPIEFVSVGMEIWQKKDKEVKFLNFAERNGIEIMPPKFRKSKGGFTPDKEHNKIYQGTGHIKGGNSQVGDLLYTLKDKNYSYFTEVIIDVIENGAVSIDDSTMTIQEFYNSKTNDELKAIDKEWKKNPELSTYEKDPLSINKTKMTGLISLNFFEEFGMNKKLQQVYDYVTKNYKPANKTFSGKQAKYLACIEYEKSLPNERVSIIQQCEFELYYTGRVVTKSESIPAKYGFVTNIDKVGKTRTSADIFLINKGVTTPIKVGSKVYRNAPFEVGDLIELSEIKLEAKGGYQDGKWVKSPTEKEVWVKQLKFIRKSAMAKK